MPIDFPSNPTLNQIFSTNTKSWIYGTAGWKAYDIQGTVANNVVRQTTASSNQTLFTVPNYVQGQNQIRVFINGVRQNNVVDFAETSSTTITLTDPATVGDNVAFEVITYAGTPVFTGIYPTIIDDTSTNATRYPLFAQGTGGSLSIVNTDSTGLTFNPSSAELTVGSLKFGDGTTQSTTALALAQAAYGKANAEGTINNTQNTNITNVNTFAQAAYTQANTVPTNINTRGIQTNANYFPSFVDANNATNATETVHTHANLTWNPSTGVFSAPTFSGAGTSLTGTASSLSVGGSAGSAANLTGGNITGNYILSNASSPNTVYLQFGDNTGWTYRFMTNVSGTPTARFSFVDSGNFTAVGSVTASSFSGAGTGLTGTASGFTANNATYWAGLPLPTAGAVPGASNIPRTDVNGYLFVNYINSNTAVSENPTVGNVIVVNSSNDGYYRKSTPANIYGGSWSSWYAGQVAQDQLGSYAYLGYGAAATTAITAGTNQAGSLLRFWGSSGAVNAGMTSTTAAGATPSGTWKPVGSSTSTASLVKHSMWVRVA